MLIHASDLAPIFFGHRRDGVCVIISFFGDDSSDKLGEKILCAGGFFGWPGWFWEAENKWNARLEKDKITYFRASECEGLIGEFDPKFTNENLNAARARAESVRRDLIGIINPTPVIGIAIGLYLPDWEDVIKANAKARKYYGLDPKLVVYKKIIRTTIEVINKDHPRLRGVPVAFTFDDFEGSELADEAYSQLQREDATCAESMGYHGHADDKKHSPIQMGDLMAHEGRHAITAWIEGRENDRYTFEHLKDAVFFIGVIRKKELLSGLEDYPD